ncbi:MAG: hypothetical protein LC746_00405 [Acidobacteria bacterium]|nr:hypothetical protein [Acidobacteriota bacterium]
MVRGRAKRYARNGLALLVGGAGGVGLGLLLLTRKRVPRKGARGGKVRRDSERDRWARPGMEVTFRAELMPSRAPQERTFRVAELLPSGRVRLEDFAGEHTESEFEPVR